MYIMLFLQNKELFNSTVICLLEFIPFMNDELVIYFLKIKSYFLQTLKYIFFIFLFNQVTIVLPFVTNFYQSIGLTGETARVLLHICVQKVCFNFTKKKFLINFLGHFFNQRFVFALIVDNYSSIISFTRRKFLWYWHTRRGICLPRVGFKYNRGM